jgi:hypothetical protein
MCSMSTETPKNIGEQLAAEADKVAEKKRAERKEARLALKVDLRDRVIKFAKEAAAGGSRQFDLFVSNCYLTSRAYDVNTVESEVWDKMKKDDGITVVQKDGSKYRCEKKIDCVSKAHSNADCTTGRIWTVSF